MEIFQNINNLICRQELYIRRTIRVKAVAAVLIVGILVMVVLTVATVVIPAVVVLIAATLAVVLEMAHPGIRQLMQRQMII